jgi:hypothetical protein
LFYAALASELLAVDAEAALRQAEPGYPEKCLLRGSEALLGLPAVLLDSAGLALELVLQVDIAGAEEAEAEGQGERDESRST